ncbi:MAG: lipoyl domain-containing protein [Planctomycetes bacterium]|nr:lipoyl domain-containing protein [Planctomycetota bacterium]
MTAESPLTRIPITVPDLGSGTESIRISAWLMDLGQTVIAGDPVVEVLLPGITFDIQTTHTGVLVEISRVVDASVQPGDVVGWIAPE